MEGTNLRLSYQKLLEGTDVLIAIFIVTAMSFVPASFVLFLVAEKQLRSKHLQTLAGELLFEFPAKIWNYVVH